jgi:hypothetical protein
MHSLLVFLNHPSVRLWITVFLTTYAVTSIFKAAFRHAVLYRDRPVGRVLHRMFFHKKGKGNA